MYPDHIFLILQGSPDHDNQIFTLAVLLSNSITYNSLNAIDNAAIMDLHFISEIAKLLRVNQDMAIEDKDIDLSEQFPTFIWSVRDFHLKLEIEGKAITSDDYLEDALKLKKQGK